MAAIWFSEAREACSGPPTEQAVIPVGTGSAASTRQPASPRAEPLACNPVSLAARVLEPFNKGESIRTRRTIGRGSGRLAWSDEDARAHATSKFLGARLWRVAPGENYACSAGFLLSFGDVELEAQAPLDEILVARRIFVLVSRF